MRETRATWGRFKKGQKGTHHKLRLSARQKPGKKKERGGKFGLKKKGISTNPSVHK